MLIDSHCHLDFPELNEDLPALLARAREAGVGLMVTISTRVAKFADLKEIVETHDNVFCSIGTHPNNAAEEPDITAAELIGIARHPKVVAIGEAGLDYHYDRAPRDVAQRVFRTHIDAARKSGLPLVIHTRDADADTGAILEEEMGKGAFTALLHCFTASRELAERALALGLYISFSGVLTFKNSQELRDVAAAAPLDRILVETDAPFLAPVPFRGKRNEPAFVAKTAAVVAEARGMGAAELAAATTANALRLFSKMPPIAA